MTSLRRRLLAIFLALFTLAWGAMMVASFFSARHEVEELFDAELAQSARVLMGLVVHELVEEREDAATLQEEILGTRAGHDYQEKIAFQLWRGADLLLRSPNAPERRFTSGEGFHDVTIDDRDWRVYVTSTAGDFNLQVGERHDIRNELIHELLVQMMWPALLILPLLAGLTWTGIGRGLRPLRRVTEEIGQRSHQLLDPLKIEDAPDEVRPLVVALNDLLARLAAAFERERRFTANAAHELRTPLAGLKAQAQVALRANQDGERRRAVLQILRGVDRATHLVEQLLTLARVDPDVAAREFTRLDLGQLCARVVGELAPAAAARHIDLGLECAAPLELDGDARVLPILVRNLVDNAVRYTPDGGRVTVAVAREDGAATLSVTDSGPGIPAELRTRVFARFYRLPDAPGSGCGLGLSIVQRIAELHGASVELMDAPGGRGLRVRVRFAPATTGP
ncbi:MAG TPA: ATP-binding protein [Acidiferrobacterales bacterium]